MCGINKLTFPSLSRRPRTKRSGEGLIEGIESHQIQRGPVHADGEVYNSKGKDDPLTISRSWATSKRASGILYYLRTCSFR